MQQVADVLAGALPLTDYVARTDLEVEFARRWMLPHPLFATNGSDHSGAGMQDLDTRICGWLLWEIERLVQLHRDKCRPGVETVGVVHGIHDVTTRRT